LLDTLPSDFSGESCAEIWMSNTRSSVACERAFFAVLCDNLVLWRGARRVAERFQSLAALAALPSLEQPRSFEPMRLIFEAHAVGDRDFSATRR
jgi:hypothetical protein